MIAQWLERLAVNQMDVGSSPTRRENIKKSFTFLLEIAGFEPATLCTQNIHSTNFELYSLFSSITIHFIVLYKKVFILFIIKKCFTQKLI